jgi:hypothetical protein
VGGVAAAQGQLQARGHLDEDDVPEVRAHAVVDDAEPVEVQAQDGDPAAGAARPLQRPGDAVEPEGAVGQARQRVVQRLMLQHLQRQPRLGEVGDLHQGVPWASAVVGDGDQRDRRPHRLATRPLVAPLEVEPLALAGGEAFEQDLLGRPVGAVEVVQVGADKLARRSAEQRGESRVHVQDPAVEGERGEPGCGVLGEGEHVLLGA